MNAPDLLLRLLRARGPSGFEAGAAVVWREAASEFADVTSDSAGNSFARVPGARERPLLAVLGHVDEIGLIVTHVDDRGFVSFRGLGGWDAEVLLGQRVEVLARGGIVSAVVARKRDPKKREEKKAAELKDLHLDVGARDRSEAESLVGVGDAAVLAAPPLTLASGRLASRALDNRLGAYVALESARRVAEAGGAPGDVVGVATVQEETGDYAGARTSVFALEPDVAIAVDVTPATDVPGGDPKEQGEQRIGAGAAILRGPGTNAAVFDLLRETAERDGIPFCVEVSTGRSHTDADAAHLSRAGVPTAVVSVPTRYLHTPVELVDPADVEACVRLVVSFAQRVPELDIGARGERVAGGGALFESR